MDIITYVLCKRMIENIGPSSGVFHIQGTVEKIDDLPIEGNQGGDIYLVGPKEDESYDEYFWLEGQEKWEMMGTTNIDLSEYMKKGALFKIVNELPTGNDIDPDVIYLMKQEGGQDNGSI